jgi:alkaline phosphatase D
MRPQSPALPASSTAPPQVPRRSFLTGGLLLGGALAAGVALPRHASAAAAPRLATNPFTLGVASGDPSSTGVVLWTRLAVDPLADDGLGGMPTAAYDVAWQLSTEPRFRNIVKRGRVPVGPESGHSAHVEVEGLEPGREYWYRFRTDGHVSPAARTRTAPAERSFGGPLTLAAASCAQWEAGFFTAYRRLAQDEPDLVLHLGDYFYENANPATGMVRNVVGREVQDLADYRRRHAQYKTDLDLQAAHAVAPWVVVFDDHEVDNNWADEVPENDQPAFLARRAAAFQAYYENMPLRSTSMPRGIDMQLYRRIQWGRLATFHMLDTRQYRSDQACGDGTDIDCAERLDPVRSITGPEQEAWLLDGLGRSTTTWDVLGQQVFFSQRDFDAGIVDRFSMDAWDGYVASRDRILTGAVQRGVSPVVLTGDVHRHYAADLKADFEDLSSPTIGVELVTTSITSGGNGSDRTAATDVQLGENPHVKFANTQRGYLRARISRQELRADFRVLPYVDRPGAPVSTRQSFVVDASSTGLQPVAAADTRV